MNGWVEVAEQTPHVMAPDVAVPGVPVVPETDSLIDRLDAVLCKMPQVDLLTEHALCGAVYARTVYMKADQVVVGATHKSDHIAVVIGDVSVRTDEGLVRLTGHHVLMSKAGTRRAVYAHADSVWSTFHHTEQTELDAIEDELAVESGRLQTRNANPANAPLQLLEDAPCL